MCREHSSSEDLSSRWHQDFVVRASELFKTKQERSVEAGRECLS
jgi:hypothetical protein